MEMAECAWLIAVAGAGSTCAVSYHPHKSKTLAGSGGLRGPTPAGQMYKVFKYQRAFMS
jgi:hypothetical protein